MKFFTWEQWVWLGVVGIFIANGLLIWSFFTYGNIIRNPVGILGLILDIVLLVGFRKLADKAELKNREK